MDDMCGISGLALFDADKSVNPGLVHQMASTLTHRGPDAAGQWVNGNLGVGFRRLNFIDLPARGNQPFVNPAGSVFVCNGEIYNDKRLREGLIAHDHGSHQQVTEKWHFRPTQSIG
jgi:asparagine synthase (glutamine-hydrolysing)